MVCPFVADQPHWARQAHALGVVPAPIRHNRLTTQTLADALTAVADSATRSQAEALGHAVRRENGPATAVTALEELLR